MEFPILEQMEKLLIIVNPISGRGKGIRSMLKIQTYLLERSIPFCIEMTEEPGHAIALASQGVVDGVSKIISAGGDGTLREVVSGIMQHYGKRPLPSLGILTVGRGNDFAFGAGVLNRVDDELAAIVQGNTTPIDVGVYRLNGGEQQYFINGIGIGIEPRINKIASSLKIRGSLSYVIAAIRVLIHLPKPYTLRVSRDENVENFLSQQLSIGNGSRMGGRFIMTPKSNVADGLLDFSGANRPVKWREVIGLVRKFLKGSQVGDSRITYSQHTTISIDSVDQAGFICHADGEHLTDTAQSLSAHLEHHALNLIIP